MSWTVGLVAPNKEFMCQMDMARLGLRSYIPQGTRMTKPKRKKKPVRTSFFPFPGYIFVKNLSLEQLKKVRGFRRVIFNDIPDKLVQEVQEKQAAGAFDIDALERRNERYQRNDLVRITMGPLMGMNAIIRRDTKGENWAELDVNGMRVKIFIDFIEKI